MKKRFGKFLKEHWLFSTIVILILAAVVYSYFSQGLIFSLIYSDTDSVANFITSFGIFAEMIFVLIVVLEVVIAPMPPLILYIVAGLLFGGFIGGVLTLLGNLIGAFIDFKISRNLGKRSVEKNINKNLKRKFDNFFEKYGAFSIFILRINPLTTSDIVSYLAGFTKIKTRSFLIATGLGLIPLIFIQTYLGDIFLKDHPVLSAITILISLFYLLIFGYLIFKIIVKKHKSPSLKMSNHNNNTY